ncbi:MAG TPA: SMC-Scp complex subunit ScpB [Pyrinomonadaceae bacterium]|nr:SMC-Scp complex subunit ScpB [Pyrinomonadaceae bacterium]
MSTPENHEQTNTDADADTDFAPAADAEAAALSSDDEDASAHEPLTGIVEADDEEADEFVEDDDDEDEDEDEDEVTIFDADAEDAAELAARLRAAATSAETVGEEASEAEVAPGGGGPREMAELIAIIEALIFVSEEPLPVKTMAEVLKEERGWVQVAVEELAKEFNERNGGLMLREVAGGWQFATRPEHHEHVRAYLKSRPSAKLSLAALETLAVIAYKQPITVPEILEIRGVQSSSAIKTLLDKRLIIAKGRKETVGRPMMYGTSKEFLLQFGLKDLTELPNVEDFDDLTTGGA